MSNRSMRGAAIISPLLALALATLAPPVSAKQPKYREGVHYYKLSSPLVLNKRQDGKVDVKAFFWYGCPHCRQFEKPLSKWLGEMGGDIAFSKVPAVWNQKTGVHSRIFFTAKILGVEGDIRSTAYRKLLDELERLDTSQQVYKQVFKQNTDITYEKFIKVWRSFSVKTQRKFAEHLARDSELTGTPTMVVAGKYRVVSNAAISLTGVLDVSKYLVKLEQRQTKNKKRAQPRRAPRT